MSRKDDHRVLKLWGQLQELIPDVVKITVWLVLLNTDYSDGYCYPIHNFPLPLLLDVRQNWLVHLLSQCLQFSNDPLLDNAFDIACLQCYWFSHVEFLRKKFFQRLIVVACAQPALFPSKLLFLTFLVHKSTFGDEEENGSVNERSRSCLQSLPICHRTAMALEHSNHCADVDTFYIFFQTAHHTSVAQWWLWEWISYN